MDGNSKALFFFLLEDASLLVSAAQHLPGFSPAPTLSCTSSAVLLGCLCACLTAPLKSWSASMFTWLPLPLLLILLKVLCGSNSPLYGD